MAFFQSFRNSNGSWTTVRWTVGDWALGKAMGMLVVLILGHMIVFAGAFWFWLIFFVDNEEDRYWDKRWGVGCCVAFFFDYHFGGVGYRFFYFIFGDAGAFIAARVMMTLLIYHLVMCFFDYKIWQLILNDAPDKNEYENRWTMFWMTIPFLIGVFYFLSSFFAGLVPHAVIEAIRFQSTD